MTSKVCSVLLPLLPKNAFFTSKYVFSSLGNRGTENLVVYYY